MAGGLDVRVLGPIVVAAAGRTVPVPRPLERALLVRLVLARGRGVADERLVGDLWDDPHPDRSDDTRLARLRVVASRLRSTLGPSAKALVRVEGGYRLDAEAVDLSAACVAADRALEAVRTGDHAVVRAAARDALDRWRGNALADLRSFPFARVEGDRLDAWRVELAVQRLRAEVTLGPATDVLGELTELVAAHPLHEALRGMLAVALHRAGRQADALAELAALRRALADELGVDPTPETNDLEVRLLRQDPGLRPASITLAPTRPPRPVAGPTEIGPALAGGLVGRRTELVALAARLDEAMAGRAGVVLVEGPPGIGRTRMLEAVEQVAEQHPVTVCRGTAASGAPAFWPWRRAFMAWRRQTDPATAELVLTRVGTALARVAPELAADDGAGSPGPTVTIDPDDRFGLFEQVVAFLDGAAPAAPGGALVMLLDDLHLADLTSVLLLGHLARSGLAAPVLIVATLQPDALRPEQVVARADLVRHPATSRIELAGLGAEAVTEQLCSALGRACEPSVAAEVATRTGGNPLFVREIGRLMRAGGAAIGPTTVPAAIRDAVRRRLEALPPACREVLSVAAVLGGAVDAETVAAAAGGELLDVLDQLDAGVAAGFLQSRDRTDHLRFPHEIVREAVASDTGSGRRARLHLRAAEHLEAGGSELVHRIAYHRLAALPHGDPAFAVRATTDAADLALRRFAFEDAVALYDHALDAGTTLGLAARAGLQLGKARAQYLSHDVAGAMRTCEDVVVLAEHRDDAVLLGRAATVLQDIGDAGWLASVRRWCRTALAGLDPQDGPLRAQVTAQLAVAAVWDDDGYEADSAAGPSSTGSVALTMADRVGDPAAAYTALRARQLALAGPDHTHERLDLGDRMLALGPAVGDPAALWGRLWRFDALVQLGRIVDADHELDLLEPVVTRMRQPLPRWHFIRCRAALLAARGQLAEARVAADDAVAAATRGRHLAAEYPSQALRLAIAEIAGDPVDPVVFVIERSQPPPHILSMMASLAYVARGELDEASRVWGRLPRFESLTSRPFMHPFLPGIGGMVAAAVGDRRAADHAYGALAPYADLHLTVGAGVGHTGGSVHRALGIIAAARDEPDVAVEHLRAAVAANTAAGLFPYAALARRALTDQLRRRNRPGDADEVATLDVS